MIGFFCGLASDIEGAVVTVYSGTPSAGGIGYNITTPDCDLVEIGSMVSLWVHAHVTEGETTLYGFLSKAGRTIFRRLLTVPGVGPKMATSVMRHIGTEAVMDVVAAGDAARLERVPGVGRKTAARIVAELGPHVGPPALPAGRVAPTSPWSAEVGIEATHALRNLGYSAAEAEAMLASATRREPRPNDVQSLVRACLAGRAG